MDSCNLRHFFSTGLPAFFLIGAIQATQFATLCYADSISQVEPRLTNPFCSVETYVQRDLHTQARAVIEPNGRAIIQLGPDEAAGDPAYRDFLMAHECCHHTRGHLQRMRQKSQERALLDLSFVNRSLELDADCCAGIALANAGQQTAIHEASRRMRTYGLKPTGAGGYPAGMQRAMLIEQCADSIDKRVLFTPLNR